MEVTVLDFWAPWCNPCMTLKPQIEKIEEQYKDKVEFKKINADESIESLREYGVRNIPTALILKDGEVQVRLTGIEQVSQLEQELLNILK